MPSRVRQQVHLESCYLLHPPSLSFMMSLLSVTNWVDNLRWCSGSVLSPHRAAVFYLTNITNSSPPPKTTMVTIAQSASERHTVRKRSSPLASRCRPSLRARIVKTRWLLGTTLPSLEEIDCVGFDLGDVLGLAALLEAAALDSPDHMDELPFAEVAARLGERAPDNDAVPLGALLYVSISVFPLF